jgi:hypothetical protein
VNLGCSAIRICLLTLLEAAEPRGRASRRVLAVQCSRWGGAAAAASGRLLTTRKRGRSQGPGEEKGIRGKGKSAGVGEVARCGPPAPGRRSNEPESEWGRGGVGAVGGSVVPSARSRGAERERESGVRQGATRATDCIHYSMGFVAIWAAKTDLYWAYEPETDVNTSRSYKHMYALTYRAYPWRRRCLQVMQRNGSLGPSVDP